MIKYIQKKTNMIQKKVKTILHDITEQFQLQIRQTIPVFGDFGKSVKVKVTLFHFFCKRTG